MTSTAAKLAVLILPALIVSGALAQLEKPEVEFARSGINLKVNESSYYSLKVKNNLNRADDHVLRTSVTTSRIGFKVEEITVGGGNINCESDYESCLIPLNAKEEVTIPFQLTGKRTGQVTLLFNLQSDSTGLADEERVEVAISGGSIGHTAPGLNLSSLFLLLIVATLIYGWQLTTSDKGGDLSNSGRAK